jgi:ADP-ribose pyrophosphatase
MNEAKTIESKQLYKGKVVQLRLDTVLLPDGRTKTREILAHPGAAAIVSLTNGKVLLVEQYRKAVERNTLEIPAGTLEEGESYEECAMRELTEETGFQASSLNKLTEYLPSPGYSSEIIHIYKANELTKVSDAELSITFVELSEVLALIRKGDIKDGKTVVGVLMVAMGTDEQTKIHY